MRLAHGDPKALSRIKKIIVPPPPDWVDGQVALAGFRWESGDVTHYLSGIERARAKLLRHAGLGNLIYISLLAGGGKLIEAANAAQTARRRGCCD